MSRRFWLVMNVLGWALLCVASIRLGLNWRDALDVAVPLVIIDFAAYFTGRKDEERLMREVWGLPAPPPKDGRP